jgi:hypothetical protein
MAVREVNLVPDAVLQRRYMQRHGVGWAMAYGLVIALIFGGSMVIRRHVTAKGRSPADEADVRKRLATTIAEIETKKEGFARLTFVREISCPVGVAQVLGRVGEAMDAATWLTHLSVTDPRGAERELALEGLARSNTHLGATIDALARNGAFRDVVLGNATEVAGTRVGEKAPEPLVRFSARAKAIVK